MVPDKPVLTSVSAVVEKAGGPPAVARRFGYADSRAVLNQIDRGFFPPETYVAWHAILDELGVQAPDALWRQREVA